MKLNKVEFLAMNNPIRRLIQRNIEFTIFDGFLRRHKIELKNGTILDAGCGSGYSTRLISKQYDPKELIAFDFMPEQIRVAQKKDPQGNYFVGDITDNKLPSNKFDAAFVFGILHHVPDWEKAIQELYRVLSNGGVLLIEEVNDEGVAFVDKYCRFHHPDEANFKWQEFSKILIASGFIIEDETKIVWDYFRSFLCIKDQKTRSSGKMK